MIVVVFAAALLYVADYLLQPDRLPVQRISFVGEFQNVSRDALQEVAIPYVGKNFLAMDLDKLEEALSEVPWVAHVSVGRRWPDTLQINFRETQLIARWNDNAWVTEDADVITLATGAYSSLPRWFGPEDSHEFVQARHRQFSSILARGGLRTDVIRYSARGAWQIEARPDDANQVLRIKLGRNDLQERLQRFMHAYTQSLSHMNEKLEIVDLRYPNGFALQWDKTQEKEAG
jgi:cell division protein FtsQ